MLQLIYVSTASAEEREIDLAALCEEASRNNVRDEITGILMLERQCFLQVLEGPKETVENTFLRVVVDDRHHSLVLLSRMMLTRREFGDWSMATCDAPEERKAIIERVRSKLHGASARIQQEFAARFPG